MVCYVYDKISWHSPNVRFAFVYPPSVQYPSNLNSFAPFISRLKNVVSWKKVVVQGFWARLKLSCLARALIKSMIPLKGARFEL